MKRPYPARYSGGVGADIRFMSMSLALLYIEIISII